MRDDQEKTMSMMMKMTRLMGEKHGYIYMSEYIKKMAFYQSYWITSAVGNAGIEKELVETDHFDAVIETEFEGRSFYVPKEYDVYNKNLYRRVHIVISVRSENRIT